MKGMIDSQTLVDLAATERDKPASIVEGAYFDNQSLELDLCFFDSLTLTKSTRSGRPEPLVLLPPHKKLVTNLLGWKRKDGTRLYRRVYFSVARKNSKSTLCAALAVYFLVMDNEQKPEIYLLAKTREQASIVFDAACDFINAHEELRSILKITPYSKHISNPLNGGIIKALSGEGKQQHGKNPSVCIFDELHVWDSSEQELFDSMTSGSVARKQPTFIFVTTAGVDENTICGREYQYASKVQKGLIEDPGYLPMIYELDRTDNWRDESNWIKANPCLGDIVSIQALREMRDKALNSPTDAVAFQRLQCNQWVNSLSTWIPTHKWDLCKWSGEAIANV